MRIPKSIQETLEGAVNGMLSEWRVENTHVVVEYHNGFSEVIWFKDNASAVTFSNALSEIKRALDLRLGKPYTD